MSQKLPANGFEWVEDLSQFKENFIKNYDENSNKGYFLEVHVEYSNKLFNLHKDLPFLAERLKIGKCKKFICNIRVKENYVCSNKSLKTSIESWINTKNITKCNSI